MNRLNYQQMINWIDPEATRVLNAVEERRLLEELVESRTQLEGGDDGSGELSHRVQCLRNALAMANVRLVHHLAKRYRNRGIAEADLVQEGLCGLLMAIDRFNMAYESRLGTYASWWIRQAMDQAIANGAYAVRLNTVNLNLLRDDAKVTATPDTLRRIRMAARPALSLDTSHGSGIRDQFLSSHSQTDVQETIEAIVTMIDILSPRERAVLSLRFGLGGGDAMTLNEIGDRLGLTKEGIRKIQERALDKLREVSTP
jgi:RNA polymerase primary sigma factor